jgi:methylamine dehydrogenase accessory protein MauD
VDGWWLVSYLVLWIVVAVLAVVVVALARQIGTLHLRLGPRGALEVDDEGPPLGEAPESIEALDLDGRSVVVGGPGGTRVLMFVSPGCIVCERVIPGFRAAANDAGMDAAFVTELDRDEAAHAFATAKLPARLIPAPELVRSYDVPGTPFVVVLDELGVVRAKGTPNDLEQLEGLIDTARRRMKQPARDGHVS